MKAGSDPVTVTDVEVSKMVPLTGISPGWEGVLMESGARRPDLK